MKAKRLTDRQLTRLVDRAIAGERCLHDLVDHALFGSYPDPVSDVLWGDWPDHAIDAWDRAIEIWQAKVQRPKRQSRSDNPIDLTDTWEGIERAVVEAGTGWPKLTDITMRDLAQFISVSPRSIGYWMQLHGWKLSGRGKTRRIVLAPCFECERSFKAEQFEGRYCPSCHD